MTLLQKTVTSDNYSQNQGCIPLKTIGMEIKVSKNYLPDCVLKGWNSI